jgi:DNA-binding IclR family transcriptional regulator
VAVDDGEYAVGVCCLAARVTAGAGAGAVGVVITPRGMDAPATRQTLLVGAGRVSRALRLGAA